MVVVEDLLGVHEIRLVFDFLFHGIDSSQSR